MEVSTREYKRVDLVKVGGLIDSAAALQLEAILQEIVGHGRFHLVVDMHDVEYLSSAGLRVLVSAVKQARRWNRGDVRLADVPERVKGVLRLAGLDVLFRIYDTTVDAVASF